MMNYLIACESAQVSESGMVAIYSSTLLPQHGIFSSPEEGAEACEELAQQDYRDWVDYLAKLLTYCEELSYYPELVSGTYDPVLQTVFTEDYNEMLATDASVGAYQRSDDYKRYYLMETTHEDYEDLLTEYMESTADAMCSQSSPQD